MWRSQATGDRSLWSARRANCLPAAWLDDWWHSMKTTTSWRPAEGFHSSWRLSGAEFYAAVSHTGCAEVQARMCRRLAWPEKCTIDFGVVPPGQFLFFLLICGKYCFSAFRLRSEWQSSSTLAKDRRHEGLADAPVVPPKIRLCPENNAWGTRHRRQEVRYQRWTSLPTRSAVEVFYLPC